MKRVIILVMLLIPAFAGTAFGQALSYKDVTPGTVLGTVVAQVYGGLGVGGVPPSIGSLTIANDSATATISCGFKATVTAAGMGTFTIAPNQTAFWPFGSAPKGPIWCISSAAGTNYGVFVGQ